MVKLSPDELANLAERVKHLTAENLIAALKEQGPLGADKEDLIQLMSSVASVAIANALIYLQQHEEQRSDNPYRGLVQ